jgi:hypothetical protein
VCVLSAAIGSAISLIAQTGPAGPRGPQGKVDTRAIEAEIEAVRSEADVSGLEEQVTENEEQAEGAGASWPRAGKALGTNVARLVNRGLAGGQRFETSCEAGHRAVRACDLRILILCSRLTNFWYKDRGCCFRALLFSQPSR